MPSPPKDKQYIAFRKEIASIPDRKTFNELLDETMLTDEERNIAMLYYCQGKDLHYICDTLGYSYTTIKRRFNKITRKLGNLLKTS